MMLNASRPRASVRGASFVALALLLSLGWAPIAPTATAQTPSSSRATNADTVQVTFNRAVRMALDRNTTLKRAANEVNRTDARISAERMDFVPTLELSSSLRRQFGRQFSQEQLGFINQSTDFFLTEARANLTLFDGLSNVNTLRQARSQGEASTLSLDRTRQDVVFQVMNRYLTLVENREVLRVQREELESRRQQLRQIEEFVDAGSRPVSALYEQQAAVAEQESNVLTSERDVELAETRLLQVLQLDPMGAYTFEAPTLPDDSLRSDAYNQDALLRQAMNRRTDLRAARAEARAAESGVRVAKSSYWPTLSLSASYGTDWTSEPRPLPVEGTEQPPQVGRITPVDGSTPVLFPIPGTGGADTFQPDFSDQLDNNLGGSVGLSLTFPLFDGLRRNQQIEEAQVQARNAEYDLEDQKLQIALEVREAYLNYRNAVQQLDATQKRLRAARQARQAAQERYNLGAASIVELTTANRNFVEAASQRIRARYNFVFQQKLIDYYVGILDPSEALFE